MRKGFPRPLVAPMLSNVHTIDRHLHLRRCVACGYDGSLLRNGHADRCARCGCDLHERPARSYAEMEGLDGLYDEQPLLVPRPRRDRHFLHKWIAFMFISLLFIMSLGYLAGSVLGI